MSPEDFWDPKPPSGDNGDIGYIGAIRLCPAGNGPAHPDTGPGGDPYLASRSPDLRQGSKSQW